MHVDAGVGELVGHVGQLAGLVFHQNGHELALLEANVGVVQGGTGRVGIVGNDPHHPLAPERHGRHRFDVDAGAPQDIGHTADLSGPMRQMKYEVFHDCLPVKKKPSCAFHI